MSSTASSRAAEAQHTERARALAAFTQALAPRLPGDWAADIMDLPTTAARNALHERLWDLAHADWALGEFVYSSAGVLRGPAGRELLVLPRPFPHTGQYIVAPLLPAVFGRTTDDVEHLSPHGITVAPDPVRAAAAVTGRLLPRYDTALRGALPDFSPDTDLPWGDPWSYSDSDPAALRDSVRAVLAVTEYGLDDDTRGLAEVLPCAAEYVSGYDRASLVQVATAQALLFTAGLGTGSLLDPEAPRHLRSLSALPRPEQYHLLRQTAARLAEPPPAPRPSAARLRSASPLLASPTRPSAPPPPASTSRAAPVR
ncbi:hypothetical protein [Kitasatospora sp. NPDC001095]